MTWSTIQSPGHKVESSSRRRRAYYCSRQCHVADWPRHKYKAECGKYIAEAEVAIINRIIERDEAVVEQQMW